MALKHNNINGNQTQFTAAEETARDNEETAWANAAPTRALTELRRKRDSLLQVSDWEIMQELEKDYLFFFLILLMHE
jgi:hypothetical protein